MSDTPVALNVVRPPEESVGQRRSRLRLAGMLLVSSVGHFIIPKPFMKIVPSFLGHPRFWVYASGIVEATAGALMLSSDIETRRRGGMLATAALIAVYPANIQMAVDAGRPRSLKSWVPWLRLPMQVPMVMTAVGVARR
ncbi:MAG TPA: hypothetical protein VG014_12230 [Acidimicrobiales bacterium]|jgi:uncharacterized membrane protein|nr:hypothetical protein [Acidimicrobiales bacterium]